MSRRPRIGPRSGRGPAPDGHRVYYWYTTSDGGLLVFLLVGVEARSAAAGELWVLVDEATGIAEDVVYRER